MTDTDLAYLAGFFDGEGCLALVIQPRRRRDGKAIISLGVVFVIVNTCREVLDWCLKALCRGSVVQVRNTKGNPRNLPTYRFNLGSSAYLMRLLPALRPHLRVKGRQADAALTFLHGHAKTKRGAPFSESDVDAAFELRLANQKSYNKGATEHILYKKTPYTRKEFRSLVLEGRDGAVYRVVEWTDDMDALVGTDIDSRIAKRLGLKLAQVQRRRVELGRPFFREITVEMKNQIRELRATGRTLKSIAWELHVGHSSVQRALTEER